MLELTLEGRVELMVGRRGPQAWRKGSVFRNRAGLDSLRARTGRRFRELDRV